MLPRSEINVGKLFCTSDKSSLKCYRMYMFFSRPGSMRAGIRAGTVQVLGHSQKYAIQIIALPLQISVPLPKRPPQLCIQYAQWRQYGIALLTEVILVARSPISKIPDQIFGLYSSYETALQMTH